MEKFNIDFFNKNRENFYSNYKYEEGDTIITLQEFDDVYKKTKEIKNTPYSSFIIFYKHTLSPKLRGQKFYRRSTGKLEYYDENGNATKEIDDDVAFPFSFEDLVQTIKSKFNIDLMDYKPREVDVQRSVSPYSNYQVFDYRNMLVYELNGITGDLISITNLKTGEVKRYSNPLKSSKDLSSNTSSRKSFWSTLFD